MVDINTFKAVQDWINRSRLWRRFEKDRKERQGQYFLPSMQDIRWDLEDLDKKYSVPTDDPNLDASQKKELEGKKVTAKQFYMQHVLFIASRGKYKTSKAQFDKLDTLITASENANSIGQIILADNDEEFLLLEKDDFSDYYQTTLRSAEELENGIEDEDNVGLEEAEEPSSEERSEATEEDRQEIASLEKTQQPPEIDPPEDAAEQSAPSASSEDFPWTGNYEELTHHLQKLRDEMPEDETAKLIEESLLRTMGSFDSATGEFSATLDEKGRFKKGTATNSLDAVMQRSYYTDQTFDWKELAQAAKKAKVEDQLKAEEAKAKRKRLPAPGPSLPSLRAVLGGELSRRSGISFDGSLSISYVNPHPEAVQHAKKNATREALQRGMFAVTAIEPASGPTLYHLGGSTRPPAETVETPKGEAGNGTKPLSKEERGFPLKAEYRGIHVEMPGTSDPETVAVYMERLQTVGRLLSEKQNSAIEITEKVAAPAEILPEQKRDFSVKNMGHRLTAGFAQLKQRLKIG